VKCEAVALTGEEGEADLYGRYTCKLIAFILTGSNQ
jgi:hypothetical protein